MALTISGDSPNFSTASITTGTVTTLNAPSGVLATQNGMTGICKAWVRFTGSATPTINGSFNVSSITYNGTGDFSINFTTAMPDANYAAAISCGEAGSSSRTCSPYSFSTSSYRFLSYSGANVQLNMPLNSVIILGN